MIQSDDLLSSGQINSFSSSFSYRHMDIIRVEKLRSDSPFSVTALLVVGHTE